MSGKKMPEEEPVFSPQTEAKDTPSEPGEGQEPKAEQEQEAGLLTALQEALSAEQNRTLRLAAEYDNYRKRSQKEREALYVEVKSSVISQLLPVYDNLERALKQETSDEAFFKGVEMTMAQLLEIFTKLGVKRIPALGETFDPAVHNAVSHVEDDAFGESEVVEQFLAGFKLGDKIIRHSVVKVAN